MQATKGELTMKTYKDFEYEIIDNEITINRYLGNKTDVVIPSEIEEYPVTNIKWGAFAYCSSLTNVTIPNSVTSIESGAFAWCSSLTSAINNYKAFDIVNNELYCRKYHFKENEWSDNIDNLELCERGYHFCTNLFEVFDYYWGRLDKDIAIYECEVGDVVESDTSKCVTNKIKPVKRLYREDVIRILNGMEKNY